MKVKELIEKLKELDENKKIDFCIWYSIGNHEDYRNLRLENVADGKERVALHLE